MKRISGSLVVAITVALVAGCSSEKKAVGRTDSAVKTLAELKKQVLEAQSQMNLTLVALDSTVASAPAELKGAFLDFTKEYDKLKKEAGDVTSDVQQLEKRAAAHFKAWEEEMAMVTNPELREAAAKRRAEVVAAMGRIKAEFEATRGAFQPVSVELQDIATYLSNDLSAGGVDGVRGLAGKTKEDAKQVDDRVASLVKEIDDLAAMVGRQ